MAIHAGKHDKLVGFVVWHVWRQELAHSIFAEIFVRLDNSVISGLFRQSSLHPKPAR